MVPYEKNARKSVSVPANAYQNHLKVEKNLRRLAECGETCSLNRMELQGTKIGVITASVSFRYAEDVFPKDVSFLKPCLTYLLPMKRIRDFASRVETLYVIEELGPFMEEQIKATGILCVGKELTGASTR